MQFSRTIPFLAVLVPVLFIGSALVAGESGKSGGSSQDAPAADATPQKTSVFMQATRKADEGKATKTYSNADLQKMFGAPSPRSTVSSATDGSDSSGEAGGKAEAPKDPLTQLLDEQKQGEELQAKVDTARQKVTAAQQRIVDLERRSLALKNPYLQRPSAPEDAEAAEAWNAADSVGRLGQNEQQLELAREALAAAQQELADLGG